MTFTATSTSCAPARPWRSTNPDTRRREPPHRCSVSSLNVWPKHLNIRLLTPVWDEEGVKAENPTCETGLTGAQVLLLPVQHSSFSLAVAYFPYSDSLYIISMFEQIRLKQINPVRLCIGKIIRFSNSSPCKLSLIHSEPVAVLKVKTLVDLLRVVKVWGGRWDWALSDRTLCTWLRGIFPYLNSDGLKVQLFQVCKVSAPF